VVVALPRRRLPAASGIPLRLVLPDGTDVEWVLEELSNSKKKKKIDLGLDSNPHLDHCRQPLEAHLIDLKPSQHQNFACCCSQNRLFVLKLIY